MFELLSQSLQRVPSERRVSPSRNAVGDHLDCVRVLRARLPVHHLHSAGAPHTGFQQDQMFTIHLLSWLQVERKPMYYLINIVLPCIFISFVGLLTFILPPTSGEKVRVTVHLPELVSIGLI